MSNKNLTLAMLVAELDARGRVVVQGWAAIDAFRRVIHRATAELGVQVTYDPASEATLVQYVAAGALQAVEDAAKGALVGLVIGAIVGAPREGLLLGAAVGGSVGIYRGVNAVDRGWRVYIARDGEGNPVAILSAA